MPRYLPRMPGPPTGSDSRPQAHVVRTYVRLVRYLAPYWLPVIVVLLLTAVLSFVSILPQQLFGVMVDSFRDVMLPLEKAGAGVSHAKSHLLLQAPIQALTDYAAAHWLPALSRSEVLILVVGAATLILRITDGIMAAVHGYLMAFVGQGVVHDMRNTLYGHLQRLSLSYFSDNSTGDLMSRVVNDVNSLNTVVVSPISDLLRDISRLAWILGFCLWWDWRLTLAGLVAAPGLLLVTAVFGRFIRRAFRALRREIGELNAVVQENISGVRVIKGFGREDHELERFKASNRKTYSRYMRVSRLFVTFRPLVELFSYTGMVTTVCFGAFRVVRGHLSPGTFFVFMPYMLMLYQPIRGLSRFYNIIQQAVASVERVFEVLDTAPGVADMPDAGPLEHMVGDVEFHNVSFSYETGVPVLRDLSFTAAPGQMVAFVGRSGAGKTSVLNLLLRFYDPDDGAVLVDGRDIRTVTLKSLHERMAMVLQEPFLFNETVRSNIAYGKLGASPPEIEAAARAANAHTFIEALPNGYDTVIGERGVKLSGGQKQRLSIARAVLANPRILLLDEATSSVDSESETLIQNAIYRLVENRTTFVIAHRLSTILHAERIIVLDDGAVVEQGTHSELLAGNGLYRKLFDMQFRVPDDAPRPGLRQTAQDGPPAEADGDMGDGTSFPSLI